MGQLHMHLMTYQIEGIELLFLRLITVFQVLLLQIVLRMDAVLSIIPLGILSALLFVFKL